MSEWSQFRMDASQHVSRAAGQSAVAASAYRAGESLTDERTGKQHDYTHRSGVVSAHIVMPDRGGPAWTREQLWNKAEAAEKRKDARIARKIEMALPAQMNESQREELANAWAKEIANRYGVAVDYAVHLPDKEGDQRNHHVHFMMTTREVYADGFGQKAALELSNTDQKKLGLPVGNEAIYGLRVALADVLNREAERHGIDLQADPRSYAERGIDLTPTKHTGVHAVNMQRRGLDAERVAAQEKVRAENASRIITRPELILDKLTRTEAVFSRHDMARELGRYIDDAQTYQHVLARLEASAELVRLADSQAGGAKQYSTRDMILAEARMIEAAQTLANTASYPVSYAYQEAVMMRCTHLSDEQRVAVECLVAPNNLAVIAGAAGSGKSTTLQVAREIWEAKGYQVRGAALAGKAAEGLQKSSGIPSRTLHSLEYALQKGRDSLSSRDVLVIDEAGMIGSRQLGRVLEVVQHAHAKVVLVGDSRQLQPIEAGAAFRAVAEQVGVAEINTVCRQSEAWARQASQALAQGDILKGLNAYAERGHVSLFNRREDAKFAMVRDWQAHRALGGTQIILAHTNQDVRDLNDKVRAIRQQAGELGQEAAFTTEKGERPFAAGDRLVFLKNDRALGVKNGTLATVLHAEKNALNVKLDEGGIVKVEQGCYTHLDHGYAVTLHKAQGVTVDRAYVLASGGMDRHLTYVGMTRHREAATLYAGRDDFKNAKALVFRLSRAQPKNSTLDFAQRRGFETAKAWVENAKAWIERGREQLSALYTRFEQGVNAIRAHFAQAVPENGMAPPTSEPASMTRRDELKQTFSQSLKGGPSEAQRDMRRDALKAMFSKDDKSSSNDLAKSSTQIEQDKTSSDSASDKPRGRDYGMGL